MTPAQLMADVATITSSADTLALITKARESYVQGLKTVSISPAEKAKALAQFETQLALGTLEKAISAAMELPVKTAQKELIERQKSGFDEQLKIKQAELYSNFAGMASTAGAITTDITNNLKTLINNITPEAGPI